MLSMPTWDVKQGHGSFLTLKFGEPKLVIEERRSADGGFRRSAYVRGRWHLWIYCCHWRVLQDETQLAWSEDARSVVDRAAAALTGQMLRGVSVAPDEGCSTFSFDLGGSLETWPYGEDQDDEQWIISTEIDAFTYRADGTYSHSSMSTPRDLERWSPLR